MRIFHINEPHYYEPNKHYSILGYIIYIINMFTIFAVFETTSDPFYAIAALITLSGICYKSSIGSVLMAIHAYAWITIINAGILAEHLHYTPFDLFGMTLIYPTLWYWWLISFFILMPIRYAREYDDMAPVEKDISNTMGAISWFNIFNRISK